MHLLRPFANSKLTNLILSATIVSSLLLVVPSCKIPQLRHPDCGREVPDSFNGVTSSESSAQIGIDEFFNDPMLTCLIEQGLAGNQQLKILAEDIEIANNEVLKRRGAYLPFVTLGGGARLDKFGGYTLLGSDNRNNLTLSGGHFPQPLPDFLVAANLSWQIDIWRQLRNSRDSAILSYLGTAEGRNYTVTRLVAEIAENYYALMALDKRLDNLDRTIVLQQQSLEIAKARKAAARGTELAVQRFTAEVRRNESEKLIIKQDIIVAENRINFLVGRYPEPVERMSTEFFDLNLHALDLGLPVQLLQNRPDIRQAERELAAAGLDVKVARARFYPRVAITAGVGYDAFNPRYLLLTPESLIYNVAGDLVAPLINRSAIKADYLSANAKQLQSVYNYQRTVLNAFTEVINRVSMVENYTKSIEIKKQQLEALESAVAAASNLFQNARVEYIDVLFAQRDLRDARMVLIDTKREQLNAIVNTYQALGGGLVPIQYVETAFMPSDSNLPSPADTTKTGPTLIPPAPDKRDLAPEKASDKSDEE